TVWLLLCCGHVVLGLSVIILFRCVPYPLCVCVASQFSLNHVHLADGLPPSVCGHPCSPAKFSKLGVFRP
ncbi:hypothetical protein A2U01_0029027, partial [Trifolium medium]|nr:hypothetical protein [Trifolium medium]